MKPRVLPPIDIHAHIDTATSPSLLEKLGAVVFAATRSITEFERTLKRTDLITVWGLGCHPGVATALEKFNESRFEDLMKLTPYVSEIGLDGQSRVSMTVQQSVLHTILELAQKQPRILSIHSYRATGKVIELLESVPVSGVVLHWWLGSVAETSRAVAVGCMFSVNAAMMQNSTALSAIPIDRIFVETDHPSGNKSALGHRQPGAVTDVEALLAKHYGVSAEAIRMQLWSNFQRLVAQLKIEAMFSLPIQRMVSASRTELR